MTNPNTSLKRARLMTECNMINPYKKRVTIVTYGVVDKNLENSNILPIQMACINKAYIGTLLSRYEYISKPNDMVYSTKGLNSNM
jgi:hypothetical protein